MYIVPRSEVVDGHDRRARRFSRDQPSHRVPRRSALDRYPHPASELDHRCRHGTRSQPECVSNRGGGHAGQPCSRQGRLVRAVDRRSPPLSRQRRRDDAPSSRRCWATDGTLAGSDWRRRSLASRATSTAIIRVSSPTMKGNAAVFIVQSGRYSFMAR